MDGGVFDTVFIKTKGYNNGSSRKQQPAGEEVCRVCPYATDCKSLTHLPHLPRFAKKPYTHFVYPKLFRRKQDIQNTQFKKYDDSEAWQWNAKGKFYIFLTDYDSL